MPKTTQLIVFSLALVLTACASYQEEKRSDFRGDTHWTLEFTWLKNDTPTHSKTYQFESRSECFDTMFNMQKEAKKKRNESGGGLCYKTFAEGQERGDKDRFTKSY